uniref:Uncharacterized protein n=1 Tax=Arion vulgaris TaxID=1028688 RepID=A0A0B7A272_9EUPU
MAGFSWDCGFTKKIFLLVFFVVIVGLVYVLATQYTANMTKEHFLSPPVQSKKEPEQQVKFEPEPDLKKHPELSKYQQQRNALSRELNKMKQSYGQQSCEQLKVLQSAGKTVDARVSENGGWCAATSSAESTDHMWDKSFSTALSNFFKGKVVASFGDGPGLYKKHLDSLGEVISYTAFDGAPYCETVTNGVVQFLDLTAPQFGLEAYDWVISVEVGEHIPAKYEDTYLDNLVRHAKEGIVLSWALPGQSGLSHINNKELSAVIEQLNKRGFDINKSAGEPLRNAASFKWLRANVHVYYRINPQTFVHGDV